MTVFFVGAGPGAADLVTVRALRLLEKAAVVVYAGALVPDELLASCPSDARLVDSANLDLDAEFTPRVAAYWARLQARPGFQAAKISQQRQAPAGAEGFPS